MSSSTLTRALSSQSLSSMNTSPSRPRPPPIKDRGKPSKPPVVISPEVTSTVASVNDSETSPLTPISSPIVPRPAQAFPRLSPDAPSVASSSRLVMGKSPRQTKLASRDTWDLGKLGTKVWVLIDNRARILQPEDLEDLETQDKNRIWWPGRIISLSVDERPLRVSLANPSGFGVEVIKIFKPCEANIISWQGHTGLIRFTEPCFTNLVTSLDTHISPRKKRKMDRSDLEHRWHVAVDEQNITTNVSPKKAPTTPKKISLPRKTVESICTPIPLTEPVDNDGNESDLPEIGTDKFHAYPPSAPSSPVKAVKVITPSKRKRKRSTEDPAEGSADSTLTIPGELVLAIERAGDSNYWPAKILGYGQKKGTYQVLFLDGKEQAIPRTWFYIAEEEGFITCKLGKWESTFMEIQNDDDDEEDDMHHQRERSPSPMPTIPPPPANKFKLLSIRQQLAYVKPVLTAILNEKFPPAMRRHVYFIAGGAKRKLIVDEASSRGQMDPKDVEHLQLYIRDWCLRGEQRAQAVVDDEDFVISSGPEKHGWDDSNRGAARPASPTPSEATDIFSEADLPTSSFTASEPGSSISHIEVSNTAPRQYGCKAFEGLSQSEKNDYCLNVLVPEAITQILLWCNGHRTSMDILEETDEAVLYEEGMKLLRASDWVNDVVRLRMAFDGKMGQSRKNEDGKGKADGEVRYSDRGRPRRSAVRTKSYLE